MDIPKEPSPNQSNTNYKKTIVIIHTTLGSFVGAKAWLKNPNSGVSANYIIGRTGQIVELVDPTKMAWHSGRISNPSNAAKAVMKTTPWGSYVNPNKYSVGIEFAAGYDADHDGQIEPDERQYTDKQIKIGAELIKYLADRDDLEVVLKESIILTHQDFTSYKPNLQESRDRLLKEIFKTEDQLEMTLDKGQTGYVRLGDETLTIKRSV